MNSVAAIGGIAVVLVDGYTLGSASTGAVALAFALGMSGFRFKPSYL